MNYQNSSQPVPNKPGHNNPGQSEPGQDSSRNPAEHEKSDDAVSNPKKPGNDPDQTPDREVKQTPQGEPGKENSQTKVNPLPGQK
jgi:hypothetical protein